MYIYCVYFFFFFQVEDGIRDWSVTGVQTCALPILQHRRRGRSATTAHYRMDGRSAPICRTLACRPWPPLVPTSGILGRLGATRGELRSKIPLVVGQAVTLVGFVSSKRRRRQPLPQPHR